MSYLKTGLIVFALMAISAPELAQAQWGHQQYRARQGAVTGAILGAIIGDQNNEALAGAAIGGLVGHAAGRAIGRSEDAHYFNGYSQGQFHGGYQTYPQQQFYAQPQYYPPQNYYAPQPQIYQPQPYGGGYNSYPSYQPSYSVLDPNW